MGQIEGATLFWTNQETHSQKQHKSKHAKKHTHAPNLHFKQRTEILSIKGKKGARLELAQEKDSLGLERKDKKQEKTRQEKTRLD